MRLYWRTGVADLIYQVYVGKSNPLYDFCIKSVSDYCHKYGLEHIVQREPILKIRPKNSQRSKEAVERLGYLPIYEKENAFNYLDNRKVLILDSDIYIKPGAPYIFDEISDEGFAGVVEREMPITDRYKNKIKNYSHGQYDRLNDVDWKWNERGAEFFNMGMMLLNPSITDYLHGQTPEEFIRRPEFERFVNGEGNWRWSTDQTLLNYWIKKEDIKTKHLEWKWNALFKAVKSVDNAYFIHFFLADHLPFQNISSIDNLLNVNFGGHR